ncbi:MAG: hypothetical protein EBU96_07515 [Actinobacteria bacterium]|nr:hypothetical protein [Actinomycetota bacterium]
MKVNEAIDSMYEVFGIPNNASAPDIMRRRIFNDLNSAMQLLWTKGHRLLDYYTRSEELVTIPSNNKSVGLSDSIQSVLGPVKRVSDGMLLRPIRTRGEYDNYSGIYAGSITALQGAPPHAYFIDQNRGTAPDATSLSIFVVPVPVVNTQISLEVSLRAPSYSLSDYTAQTQIPIPHNYAETLLLPIARYLVCSSLFFADKTKQREPLLKAEYDRALQTLSEAA